MPTRRKRMRNAVDREAALARYQELLQTARLNDREAFRLMVEHRLWEAEGLKAAEMFARDFDRTPETFRNWLKRDGYEDLIDSVKSAAGKAGAEARHEGCQKDFGTSDEPTAVDDSTSPVHIKTESLPGEPTKINVHVREADGADDTSPERHQPSLANRIHLWLLATDKLGVPDTREKLAALGITDVMKTAQEAIDLAAFLTRLAEALERIEKARSPEAARGAA